MGDKKAQTLKKLRKLGLVQIEIVEGSSEKLDKLKEQIASLEGALFVIGKPKDVEQKNADVSEVLSVVDEISLLLEERKSCVSEQIALNAELERLKGWGDIDPDSIYELSARGVDICLFESTMADYRALGDTVKTVKLDSNKYTVKFLLVRSGAQGEDEIISSLAHCKLALPKKSSEQMRQKNVELDGRIEEIDKKISSYASYTESIKSTVRALEKDVEFELYFAGMDEEKLSDDATHDLSVVYFKGYIEAENVDALKAAASEDSWGLLVEEPSEEDNVPTKLKNNRFVSLIYPIMDFLGTVPGYFEYDISGWFLAFILIFFGIIFGDGGYGLIICAAAAIPIVKSLVTKKKVSPAFLLVGLLGLSTVMWGTFTCTWFGLPPEKLPVWLKSLSIPVITNVYADKVWHPFWTEGGVGLTTAQNLQIFCFSLALIQLTVAHIKGAARNKRSAKVLGDIGAILQLLGMYYMVLSLVVNPEVFTFGLVVGGIPVGNVAIALIGIGFGIKFVFSNYQGSILKSILASVKDIVSVLLGVVNVFSDIVSYIRLWAVGLAGAAISATVNDLVGPMLGNFLFMILAIVLLVFGHGLNMILNVLSVIVHGIRLNTLEFSSHLDMSWSGHKFKPFEE